MVEAYGGFLRALHLLPLEDCPVMVSVDKKIKQAKDLMDRDFVNETFSRHLQGHVSLQVV